MSYNQSQIGFYGVYNFYLYKIYVNKFQIFVIMSRIMCCTKCCLLFISLTLFKTSNI